MDLLSEEDAPSFAARGGFFVRLGAIFPAPLSSYETVISDHPDNMKVSWKVVEATEN